MSDVELLEPLTRLARAVGSRLAERERPAPGRNLSELAAAFREIDGPAGRVLRTGLSRLRPGARWADEFEDARLPRTGEWWVADAVDGAVQYLRGIDLWCVSVALVRDGEPVAAVLHCPPLDRTYAAAAGRGATGNGRPIAPSAVADPAAALLATSHPPFAGEQPGAVEEAARSYRAVLPAVSAVRNLGPTSWQLADTAAGRLDGFWMHGADDGNLLAGALIAREAGAVVTDCSGAAWSAGADGILVAGPALHGRLLALLS